MASLLFVSQASDSIVTCQQDLYEGQPYTLVIYPKPSLHPFHISADVHRKPTKQRLA